MKAKLLQVLLGLMLILLIIFVGGFFIGTVGLVPGYAAVYVDENTNIFYSPLSLTQEKVTELNLKSSTFQVVTTLGYKMNEEDKQNEYFQQEGRSLTGTFLERVGILPKLKPRCNYDGSWNY